MFRASLCVLLFTGCASSAFAQTPAPKPTSERVARDKSPYPPLVQPDRRLNDKLPLINNLLGGAPEEMMGNAWFELNSDLPGAKRVVDKLAKFKVGVSELDYAGPGMGGAENTLIGLTDGRISRVVLLFGTDTNWTTMEKMLRPYAAQRVNVRNGNEIATYYGSIERSGVIYYARACGYWEKTIPEKRHITITGNGNNIEKVTPEYTIDGPTAIVFDIDATGWRLSQNCRKEMRDQVLRKVVANGMNADEAIAAMRGFSSRISNLGNGGATIDFYEQTLKLEEAKVTVVDHLAVVPNTFYASESHIQSLTFRPESRLIATATLTDGLVTDFVRH